MLNKEVGLKQAFLLFFWFLFCQSLILVLFGFVIMKYVPTFVRNTQCMFKDDLMQTVINRFFEHVNLGNALKIINAQRI